MKKLIALLLALVTTLALTACDSQQVGEAAFEILDELLAESSEDASVEEKDGAEMEEAGEPEESVSEAETVTNDSFNMDDFLGEAEEEGTTTTQTEGSSTQSAEYQGGDYEIDEDGTYTTYEDVALYIVTYNHLPDNFMTKKEARELGWSGGGLDSYSYGMCIGGDRFGNNEGLLPKKKGRTYYECDIDTLHAKKRGAERIIYSNDGLVYYTEDHYESFTLLYGEE